MDSCFMTSGRALGKALGSSLEKPAGLEDFIAQFKEAARAYVEIEAELSPGAAKIKILKSRFHDVIERTEIQKVKKAACTAENDFFLSAAGVHFKGAELKKLKCKKEGDPSCEFLLTVSGP